MTTRKRIYFAMMHSLLSHEVIIWYMSQRVKNHWKDLNIKLKSVQERALQQIINVYHVISTKTLQIEINTASINIHLWKLIQKSIMNMNFQNQMKLLRWWCIEFAMTWYLKEVESQSCVKHLCSWSESKWKKYLNKQE